MDEGCNKGGTLTIGHARQLTLILPQGQGNLIVTPFLASETKPG